MAQQVRTWDGQTWTLDPGALFLDFVYTGDFGVGPWREGIILTGSDLDAWLSGHVATRLKPARPGEVESALILRERLTRVVKLAASRELRPDDHDVAQIVEAASKPDFPPVMPGHEPNTPLDASRALSIIARDAVVQLRDHGDRFRHCCGGGCPIIFLDLSRAGRRTWCSMARCGNRAKVRAYRTRTSDQEQRRSEGNDS